MDNRTNIATATGTETIIGSGDQLVVSAAGMGREWTFRGERM